MDFWVSSSSAFYQKRKTKSAFFTSTKRVLGLRYEWNFSEQTEGVYAIKVDNVLSKRT